MSTLVCVTASREGRQVSKPVFAHKGADGTFVISEEFVARLAYQIGYSPEKVKITVSEELDEAA